MQLVHIADVDPGGPDRDIARPLAGQVRPDTRAKRAPFARTQISTSNDGAVVSSTQMHRVAYSKTEVFVFMKHLKYRCF